MAAAGIVANIVPVIAAAKKRNLRSIQSSNTSSMSLPAMAVACCESSKQWVSTIEVAGYISQLVP